MRLVMLLVVCSTAAAAQPLRASYTVETLPVPGNQAGDTAILRDRFNLGRDYVFGSDSVNNGLYGFLVDGGSGLFSAFGPVGGVDARPPMEALPQATVGGLVVASASTAGTIQFLTTLPDAGFVGVPNGPVVVATPRALALADFGDAGSYLFANSGGPSLQRWRLVEDAGRIDAVPSSPIPLAFAAQAVATSAGLRRVFASLGIGGVVEIDPLAAVPTIVNVIDAGAMSSEIAAGLAIYPQRDGGALIITSVPTRDLFRIYRARPGLPAVYLADIVFTATDGGRQVRGGDSIDVWPGLLGGTASSPLFDAGVFVVCDRQNVAGANYKLIAWDAIANAATPPLPIDVPGFQAPVTPPGPPPRIPFLIATGSESATIAAVAFWPGRDALFATIDGVSAFAATDLSRQLSVSLDGGVVRGVDAVTGPERLGPLTPKSLVVTASAANDAGTLTFFSGEADGGLTRLGSTSFAAQRAGSVAVADFGDAGAFAILAGAEAALLRFELTRSDAGLVVVALADLTLPAVASSVVASSSARVFYVAAGSEGVLEVTPAGGVRQLVDAGTAADVASAVALYGQADGGVLLLTAVPGKDLFRVYRARPEPTILLSEFQVTTLDGGDLVRGAVWVDLSVAPLGFFDGGAVWPSGVLAIGSASADGGSVRLVSWGAIAGAATPALPVDTSGSRGSVGGGAAGGTGGSGGGGGINIVPGAGGRAGGRGGGGDEPPPPPPGCCNGAPSSSVLPALGFLYWLRRFGRRRAR